MRLISRRMLLAAAGAAGMATSLGFPTRAHARSAAPQRLAIPPLVDAAAHEQSIELSIQAGRVSFFPDRPSDTLGFNGDYLGPTLKVKRGHEVEFRVANNMRIDTAVHWHGLLVPAEADGGPHAMIGPNAVWRPRVKVDQPAATLWYHAHPHGTTARQVYAGLAGALLVTDEAEQALGLPSDYGVDDIPLILQDKVFDDEELVYPDHPMTLMHGLRGDTLLVNGTVNAVARVPIGLVRLRLINASNARVYDLAFADGREFHWIASDAGLLERPVARRSIWLAPGERAELLVDFSDGRATVLRTRNDPTLAGGMMGMMGGMAEPLDAAAPLVRFEPQQDRRSGTTLPSTLVRRERLEANAAARRRQIVLTMGMGGMMGMGRGRMGMDGGVMGPPGGRGFGADGMGMSGRQQMFGINGQAFSMSRIDQEIRLGDTEIWQVAGDMMPHPFHIHGVHFEVVSRAGRPPLPGDEGLKDTVLVQEPVELAIRFTQPAATVPFVYHCHTLEHEDSGMMGQYKTS